MLRQYQEAPAQTNLLLQMAETDWEVLGFFQRYIISGRRCSNNVFPEAFRTMKGMQLNASYSEIRAWFGLCTDGLNKSFLVLLITRGSIGNNEAYCFPSLSCSHTSTGNQVIKKALAKVAWCQHQIYCNRTRAILKLNVTAQQHQKATCTSKAERDSVPLPMLLFIPLHGLLVHVVNVILLP